MSVSAIVPAAGKGRRFGSKTPKLFAEVEGKPVLFYTLKNLAAAYPFKQILVATDPSHFARIGAILKSLKLRNAYLVRGGATRAESVGNALAHASCCEWAVVHDAARPLVSKKIVRSALAAAQKSGGAVVAVPATSTVKRADARGRVLRTEDRSSLYLAQTPQVFRTRSLLDRYRALGRRASSLTDEASFFDGTAVRVAISPGAASNLKVTTPEDLDLVRFYLQKRPRGRA